MALGLAMAALAGGARADGPPPLAAAAGCDFFQAELIGVLCGGTGFVSPRGEGGVESISRTDPSSVSNTVTGPLVPMKGQGGGSVISSIYGGAVERWTVRNANESVTVAVSPLEGLRVYVTGDALQYDESYRAQFAVDTSSPFGWRAPDLSQRFTGAYGGWQGMGVEATVWDRTTGSGRYVLNLSGGAQFTPGGGLDAGRDLQQIGAESGAQWRLGASGLTLDYWSSTLLQRLDNPGEILAASNARLLLANPDWGVAIGPRIDTTSVLWRAADFQTGWSEVLLGGEALIAPFRRTAYPVLRDMTLDVSAAHSLGQAGLVPEGEGSSSRYVYSASARFNFRY
jgi:hypothetical protein